MKKNQFFVLLLFVLATCKVTNGQSVFDSLMRQGRSEITEYGKKQNKEYLQNSADRLGKYVGLYKSAKEMYEALQTLKKGECLPDYSVNPQAMVPSFCTDSLGSCVKCYKEAYTKLSNSRRRLGRLKCMGLTMKNFVNKSISFGDNVSSIHAIQGLAWQKERKGIMGSYTKFKDAYDKKYKELMDSLNEAMMKIDECEAGHGQKDWYQRFGFMYVEFMAEKYKRQE